jgi:hypothetical protein
MREFDPFVPAIVHDRQSGRAIFWSPKWVGRYQHVAKECTDGFVEFDGLVLDGWLEPREGEARLG